jgi:hypothetical protein
MTRAITTHPYGDAHGVFWDFLYQAIVVSLAILATAAIYVQINAL